MSTISYLFSDYFIIFSKNTAEGFIPFQSYCLVDEYLVIPTGPRPMCLNAHCIACTLQYIQYSHQRRLRVFKVIKCSVKVA
jgi:hypothetical protein